MTQESGSCFVLRMHTHDTVLQAKSLQQEVQQHHDGHLQLQDFCDLLKKMFPERASMSEVTTTWRGQSIQIYIMHIPLV